MPIYEYECNKCAKKFEQLIMGKEKPVCPSCKTEEVKKRFSTFSVGANQTSQKAMDLCSSAHTHGGGCSCCPGKGNICPV